MMQGISKFNADVSVTPNGLEKYLDFKINNTLVFIDSMQFMNSSLDALVKNLAVNYLKYLSEEFSGDLLESVKQKGLYRHF